MTDRFRGVASNPMGLLACVAVLVLSTGVEAQSAFERRVASAFELSRGEVQDLVILEDSETSELITEIRVPGGDVYTLRMTKYSMRADDFEVWIDDGNSYSLAPLPAVTTYRGDVLEDTSFAVRGSYVDGALRAMVYGPSGTFGVQPIEDSGLFSQQYLVYAAQDILPSNFSCAVEEKPGTASGASFGVPATTVEITEIGIDADFDFYQDLGSSVSAVVNDIESVMNSVEGVFEDQFLLTYEITVIVVRTAPGTYTSTNEDILLDDFRDTWASAPESGIRRDVAHLFTDKNIDGTTIGYAAVGAICTSNAHGFSQSRYSSVFLNRVALTTHELGHNWDANHCSGGGCRIMCATLGGCGGVSPLTFSGVPVSQITSYRNSRTCLSDQVPPLSLPFEDTFPSSSLSTSNWIYIDGASSTTAGVGEPSPSRSLNLDATGSGPYDDNSIRSNHILLDGADDPRLSFYTQHRGVPSGGRLTVEYLNASLDWIELDEFVSNGVDQSNFTFHEYSLPFQAEHDEFRFRFVVDVSSSSQDWYIDDVRVQEGGVPVGPPVVTAVTPGTGPLNGGTLVSISGENFSPALAVLFGSGSLQNVQYIDSTEIQGVTPSGSVAGPINVIVSQGSGSDVLVDGFIYTNTLVDVTEAQGGQGQSTEVMLMGTSDTEVQGYSAGVSFDGSFVDIDELTIVGTDAAGADFFAPNLSNAPGDSWWTVGLVMDITPPINESLPVGTNSLVRAIYSVESFAPVGTFIVIQPESGVGNPAVDLVLTIAGGISVTPAATAGAISVIAPGGFIRGDVNEDGGLDIADAIATLAFLFSGDAASCLDAVDSNDDGMTNIADAIFTLDFLFSGGSAPPAPYPSEGPDPTADSLGC